MVSPTDPVQLKTRRIASFMFATGAENSIPTIDHGRPRELGLFDRAVAYLYEKMVQSWGTLAPMRSSWLTVPLDMTIITERLQRAA